MYGVWDCTKVKVLVAQSYLTLCDLVGCNPPGSSVHGILQARIPEWVAIPFSRGSSWPRDRTQVSCTAGKFFTFWATSEAQLYQGDINPAWGLRSFGGGNWKKSGGGGAGSHFTVKHVSCLPAVLTLYRFSPSCDLDRPYPVAPILLSLLEPCWGFDACFPLCSPCICLLETLIIADLPQWSFPSFLFGRFLFLPRTQVVPYQTPLDFRRDFTVRKSHCLQK